MSQPTDRDLPPGDGLFPIRHVCAETGINPVTLRAWERRYGLIRPHRTPKGHRLYSAEDIARIQRILNLIKEGVAVSQVGRVLERDPDTQRGSDRHTDRRGNGSDQGIDTRAGEPPHLHDPVVAALQEAATTLNAGQLERTYARLVMRHGWEGVHERAFLDAFDMLRDRARAEPAAEARLAVFSSWASATFAEQLRAALLLCEGPACPCVVLGGGYRRILGTLFLLASARQGLRVLPLVDLATPAAMRKLTEGLGAPAIAVHIAAGSARGIDGDRLRELLAQEGVPCFLTGSGAGTFAELPSSRRVSILPDVPLRAADALTRQLLGTIDSV